MPMYMSGLMCSICFWLDSLKTKIGFNHRIKKQKQIETDFEVTKFKSLQFTEHIKDVNEFCREMVEILQLRQYEVKIDKLRLLWKRPIFLS